MTEQATDIKEMVDIIELPFESVHRDQAAEYLNCTVSTVDRYCTYGKRDSNGKMHYLPKRGARIPFRDLIRFKELINQ